MLGYQDFFTLKKVTELGKSGRSLRITITHLVKKSLYPISDTKSFHEKLNQIKSDIIKTILFDFDFKYSNTTYFSPQKITFVMYFKIFRTRNSRDFVFEKSWFYDAIPILFSDFKKLVEEKFSNSPFKIISYTQPLNAIQIEFRCDKTLFSGYENALLKYRFIYSFHSLLDKFKFKYCKVKEDISESNIKYNYRICLERRRYCIFDFGICKASKNLFIKYLKMVLKAIKFIEKYHSHSPDDVYIECEDDKKLSSLTWIFYSIEERDGWNPLVFLGSDKEKLSENDLWIPKKEDLENILFNFDSDIWQRNTVEYSRYQIWRREHKLSIKCEEINYLAYLMKRDYNQIWDDKKKEWCHFPSPEQVFKINDYLTLKLEDNYTKIYVKGIYFSLCKYLLFSFSKEELSEYEEINSIDEIKHKYDQSHEDHPNKITPEVEFWGHCSNLQAWYENNYDTRLLHSNIAFPLLKKLTEKGDPLAQKVFKEEIALRFESNFQNVIKFLLEGKYLSFLNPDEIEILSQNIDFSKWEDPEIDIFFEQWLEEAFKIKNPEKTAKVFEKRGNIVNEKTAQILREKYPISREAI